MQDNLENSGRYYPVSRPISVTFLVVLVLTIGVLNLLRAVQTVKQWEFLGELLPISPTYFVISGLVWGLLGLVIAGGLFLGGGWAPRLLRVTSLIYMIYIWLDRLVLRDPSSRYPGSMFFAVLSIIILVIIFWILSRQNVRAYFGETHEH
jgi:hypothetical protein